MRHSKKREQNRRLIQSNFSQFHLVALALASFGRIVISYFSSLAFFFLVTFVLLSVKFSVSVDRAFGCIHYFQWFTIHLGIGRRLQFVFITCDMHNFIWIQPFFLRSFVAAISAPVFLSFSSAFRSFFHNSRSSSSVALCCSSIQKFFFSSSFHISYKLFFCENNTQELDRMLLQNVIAQNETKKKKQNEAEHCIRVRYMRMLCFV